MKKLLLAMVVVIAGGSVLREKAYAALSEFVAKHLVSGASVLRPRTGQCSVLDVPKPEPMHAFNLHDEYCLAQRILLL